MPRFLTIEEIVSLLESGGLNDLLGVMEDDHLECKAAPYRLGQDREKMELAKDVSALANAHGGIILIGPQTEREPLHRADIIRRVGCFTRDRIDFDQLQRVISDWVVPAIAGLRFDWHPNRADQTTGIASIFVPEIAADEHPYVVVKVVDDSERIFGSYVGVFERTRDNVSPMRPAELRDRIKDGRRFAELDARLGNIEQMVGKLLGTRVPEPPALSGDAIFARVSDARQAMGYERKPTLSLLAWPHGQAQFPTLFESRAEPVVQLLEDPPRLRDGGFDISTWSASQIVEGRLRRTQSPCRKILEIWRDGVVMSVLAGDDSYLCWAMQSTPETGLRINTLALAETVYLFCDWTLKVFNYAIPIPIEFKFMMMLSDMTRDGVPFSLSPHRPSQVWIDEDRHSAPQAAPGQQFVVEADGVNYNSGMIAYELLSRLYTWFGFEATQIPFVDRDHGPPSIDPSQLR